MSAFKYCRTEKGHCRQSVAMCNEMRNSAGGCGAGDGSPGPAQLTDALWDLLIDGQAPSAPARQL